MKRKPLTFLYVILFLFAVLFAGYSGYWYLQAEATRELIAKTIKDVADYASVEHDGIEVTGYPFTIIASIHRPRLSFSAGDVVHLLYQNDPYIAQRLPRQEWVETIENNDRIQISHNMIGMSYSLVVKGDTLVTDHVGDQAFRYLWRLSEPFKMSVNLTGDTVIKALAGKIDPAKVTPSEYANMFSGLSFEDRGSRLVKPDDQSLLYHHKESKFSIERREGMKEASKVEIVLRLIDGQFQAALAHELARHPYYDAMRRLGILRFDDWVRRGLMNYDMRVTYDGAFPDKDPKKTAPVNFIVQASPFSFRDNFGLIEATFEMAVENKEPKGSPKPKEGEEQKKDKEAGKSQSFKLKWEGLAHIREEWYGAIVAFIQSEMFANHMAAKVANLDPMKALFLTKIMELGPKTAELVPRFHELGPTRQLVDIRYMHEGDKPAELHIEALGFSSNLYGFNLSSNTYLTGLMPATQTVIVMEKYRPLVTALTGYYNRLIGALVEEEGLRNSMIISDAFREDITKSLRRMSDAPLEEGDNLTVQIRIENGQLNVGTLDSSGLAAVQETLMPHVMPMLMQLPFLMPQPANREPSSGKKVPRYAR